MKSLKDRIEELSLPQETKDKIFDAVLQAGRVSQKRTNMRLVGILSSAAVLVFIALAAVAVSVISNRSDDMIAEPNENVSSADQRSAADIDKKESSSTEENHEHENDINTSDTSKNESEASKSESKTTEESETINDPVVSSPSSYQETSEHEESIEPNEHENDINTSDTSKNESEASKSESKTTEESETINDPIVSSPSSYQETSEHEESIEPMEQSEAPVETSKPSETSIIPDPHVYERPVKTINVIVPAETELSEYAGDMHRPEGYNRNIGSGLALKIENAPNVEGAYSVIVRDRGSDFNKMVTEANERLSEPLDTNDFEIITLNGAETLNTYYAVLTKEQIFVLAENGARLSYVGSGAGNVNDINWSTPEGINTYCELLGDMYVFDGDEIRSNPDLYGQSDLIVENKVDME